MSSTAVTQVKEKLARAREAVARIRDEKEETLERAAGVAVAIATGGALGMADEKWGEDAVFGTSVPLIVGVVFTGAAMAGYGGERAGMMMLEAGKTGLGIEAYKAGSRMYRDWAEEEPETP